MSILYIDSMDERRLTIPNEDISLQIYGPDKYQFSKNATFEKIE